MKIRLQIITALFSLITAAALLPGISASAAETPAEGAVSAAQETDASVQQAADDAPAAKGTDAPPENQTAVLPDRPLLLPDGTYLLPDGSVFDPAYYAYQNQDVLRVFGDDPEVLLAHYLKYGKKEGRFPSNPVTETDKNGIPLTPGQTVTGQNALKKAISADEQLKAMGNGIPYRILCIGNSITRYGYNELWWGYWGMGATSREKDYFHILAGLLSFDYTVTAESLNFTMWESPELFGFAREASLPLLADSLKEPFDAIVLQFGENIHDPGNLSEEYRDLVSFVRNLQPSAQIVIIGDFWPNAAVERIERAVCRENGFAYVDLSDIRGKRYQLGVGAVVSGDDGQTHTVFNTAVASHPNDEAMRIIAQRIHAVLKKKTAPAGPTAGTPASENQAAETPASEKPADGISEPETPVS